MQHFILNAILSFMSLCMFSCLSIGWSFTCPGHYVDCIPFGWETLSYSIISSNTQFTVTCWTVISSFDNHASVQRAWFATLNSLRKLQSTLLKSLKQLMDKSIQTNKKKKNLHFYHDQYYQNILFCISSSMSFHAESLQIDI